MTNPSGCCLCGCGQRTSLATASNKKIGHIKGSPVDFIRGHNNIKYKREWCAGDPLPLCACGCSEEVSLSTSTNFPRGSIVGQPNQFIHGHSAYKTPFEERNKPLPFCACGCNERVKTKGSKTLRGHHMKLDPPTTRDEDRGYETFCSIWEGTINAHGYGRFELAVDGVNPFGTVLVHRQVWIAAKGPIPEGMDVHHKCGQPACVRLDHLELRTRAEHARHHRGISPEKHIEICDAIRSAEESQAGIARRFGVSNVYIWRLRKQLLG